MRIWVVATGLESVAAGSLAKWALIASIVTGK
jgi:hypothetical protein